MTELVPDAFDMKSARVVAAFGEEHEALWDEIERVFEGKVPHDKIQSFRNGAGTILYFYEEEVVDGLAAKFPTYAANFPVWQTMPMECCRSASGRRWQSWGSELPCSITIPL
ncbi:hypothetical protein [Suipraeoptans intestinalis]|uniref:hypothetical protein n=1 Tax=Suipraeoptans intestinalis TaxID=2606628 RepID=UPI002ED1ED9D